MMENLKGRAALRRSKVLVSRARRTVIGIIAMQYVIPLFCSSVAVTIIVSGIALRGDAGLKMFAPKLTGVITPVLNVLLVPLISTFTALLYLKRVQAGGESLNEAFIQPPGRRAAEQEMGNQDSRTNELIHQRKPVKTTRSVFHSQAFRLEDEPTIFFAAPFMGLATICLETSAMG